MHGTHLKPSAKSTSTAPECLAQENATNTKYPHLRSYQVLGLQHDLNPISSGGSEVTVRGTIGSDNARQLHPNSSSAIESTRSPVSGGPPVTSILPKGFGRIVRDSSGNVVHVELPSDDEAGHALKQAMVIDAPVVTPASELRIWAHDRPETQLETGSGGMEGAVIQGQLLICTGPLFSGQRVAEWPT